MQSASLRILAVVVAALMLGAPGCPRHNEEIPPPEPSALQTLAPGESVVFEFPPDHRWHPSGYLARPGDRLSFTPIDEAAHVAPAALLMHIGRSRPQLVQGRGTQKIDRAGEIVFRTDAESLGPYPAATVRIRIQHIPQD